MIFFPRLNSIKNHEIINYTSNLFDQFLSDRFLLMMIRQRREKLKYKWWFLDFLGIEDNLRIEEYIFDEGGSKKFLLLKKNNKGGKKDIINSLIIQAKNK